jgi:hypothetical protein
MIGKVLNDRYRLDTELSRACSTRALSTLDLKAVVAISIADRAREATASANSTRDTSKSRHY